jgi:hypothetical protein
MKIVSTSSRGNFIYEKNEKKILELVHPKWYSKKAFVEYDNKKIKIEPKNYWGSKYIILEEEDEKGSIDIDWKNNITITFIDQNQTTQIFKMEEKGFWKQQFEFSNLEEELVVVLTPLSNWKNWRNDFAIESSPKYSDQKCFDELIIYCGFVVRLIQQYASAGVM